MVAMSMVKSTVDEVVDVIAVRHRFVSAAGTVLMPMATNLGRATIGVSFTDFDDVLFNKLAVRMVEMAVLQVVYVVSVTDSEMPALGAVMVGGTGIGGSGHDGFLQLISCAPG
jgi:hypothetical protein